MSQDEVKILIQILNALTYRISDAPVILNILSYLNKQVTDKTTTPVVTVSPENMKIKIEKK